MAISISNGGEKWMNGRSGSAGFELRGPGWGFTLGGVSEQRQWFYSDEDARYKVAI